MAKYGAVTPQQPYSFQDDVLIPVESIEAIRSANVKMTTFMKMMQTTLSEKKSGYILMGPKHLVEAARLQAAANPIMHGHFEMKEQQIRSGWVICSARD